MNNTFPDLLKAITTPDAAKFNHDSSAKGKRPTPELIGRAYNDGTDKFAMKDKLIRAPVE
jgi:hypothetical protein